ncbi:hypothetical protein OEZ85_012649 [Tetradesmus obliquus]|uniref:Uncharacterized protein n=1 Tax=Tetradesmus obliquus TaxID=3088 RepID=A0ABY8U3D0_TETOB|nr:hypothetical protein OEZ85_012649 [Tetradesmus obliquus]
MRDPKSGMFVWQVSRDGATVTNSSISIMGQWFALNALAARALYRNTSAARADALSVFSVVDAWAHISSAQGGGYSEAASRPAMDAFQITTASSSVASYNANYTAGNGSLLQSGSERGAMMPTGKAAAAAAAAAAATAAGFSRSTNSLMNGIIALHTLYRATHNKVVTARLLELLSILCDKAVVENNIYLNYDASWRPVGNGQMPVNMVKEKFRFKFFTAKFI